MTVRVPRGGVRRVAATPSTVDLLLRGFPGRYSSELGIDVTRGDSEVERWFVAATLFGTRIAARIAARTFTVLSSAGIHRIIDASARPRDELVALLDAGGYARYDFRTATRLQDLARAVTERYEGEVGTIGRRFTDPEALDTVLGELPGWGPTTTRLFLRELRGVWPGAMGPLDPQAVAAARHLHLVTGQVGGELTQIWRLAQRAQCDERDLEAALVRLNRAHRRTTMCPGGRDCVVLQRQNH